MNPCPELQVTPHPQPPPQGSPWEPVRQAGQGSPFTDDLTRPHRLSRPPHTLSLLNCSCDHIHTQGDAAGKETGAGGKAAVPGRRAPPAAPPAAPGPGGRRSSPGTRGRSAGPPSAGASAPTAPAPGFCSGKQALSPPHGKHGRRFHTRRPPFCCYMASFVLGHNCVL